jgi:hypothetical protein
LAKNTLLRCDSVSGNWVSQEGSLAIVGISEEGVSAVTAVVVAVVAVVLVAVVAMVVVAVVVVAVVVVVAAVVVAVAVVAAVVVSAVAVAAVGVTSTGVQSRLVVAVVVVMEALKSIASLSTPEISLIDVNSLSDVSYGWNGDTGCSQFAERDEQYRRWLSCLRNVDGGRLFIYLEGCFVPDPSFLSVYVGPDFPSMLFSYLFTTSPPLPLQIPHLFWEVWLMLLDVPVVRGEYSAHTCNNCRLSCVELTRG